MVENAGHFAHDVPMTGPRVIGWVIAVCICACQLNSYAASRGISVNLKANETPEAPVVESVELYKQSHALVIGIDEYTNGWPQLSNAIRDAQLIAAELEMKGFDVELHKNLTSSELAGVFKRFFILKGDDPAARLFIWYAGHGATVDGEGYLIPADAPVPNKGAEFKLASVALRDFGTFMRQAESKHVYAVFDSCFAGTVFAAQRALPPAAITRATTMPVRQFLTSGDADQTVSDDGTFRELFIRAIRGEERADANGDGYLTASELGMFLGDRVTNLTQSLQTPRYGKLRDKNFDRGDFVFTLPEGAVATKLSNAPPPSESNNAEITFWNSIKDSESVSEFDAYLSQYPKGTFAALAMVKKQEIERKREEALRRAQAQQVFDVEFIDESMQAVKTANVRQTPFPTAPRVAQLESGARVWAVGETETPGGTWYKIARDGAELGFVYGPLLASVSTEDRIVSVEPLPFQVEDTAVVAMGGEAPAKGTEQATQAVELEDEGPKSVDEELSFLVKDLLQEVAPIDAASGTDSDTTVETGEAVARASPPPASTDVAAATSVPEPAPAQQEQAPPVAQETAQETAQEVAQQTAQNTAQDTAEDTAQDTAEDIAAATAADTADTLEDTTADATEDESTTKPATELALASATETADENADMAVDMTAEMPADTTADKIAVLTAETPAETPADARAEAATETATEIGAVDELAEQSAVPAEEAAGPSGPATVDEPVESNRQLAMLTDTKPAEVLAPAPEPELSRYVQRYIRAAEDGNSKAQLSLGYMYENGEQVEVDKVEAARWYRMAAQSGEVGAMISLGILYQDGDGVGRDLTEAAIWFKKAAGAGNADAQQTLGYMYENGAGVVQDVAEAARWYERAASQGKVAAQNNLGRLYQLGSGVAQDLDKAIYWYEKAAAQGSEAARNNLDKLVP